MKTVYVSGRMTGMPELNFPAFHAAAAYLRAQGYRVINPAELDEGDTEPMSWAGYMRRDIKALMDCDLIAMLPDWERSKGATIEHDLAVDLGMGLIFLTQHDRTAQPRRWWQFWKYA